MSLTIVQDKNQARHPMARFYLIYKPPSDFEENGVLVIGAKEEWMERMEIFSDNMMFLLDMDQKNFWSEITRNAEPMNSIVSFLQESTPFYMEDTFPDDQNMRKAFLFADWLVFRVFLRITTRTESADESIPPETHGERIYDNYLITIPTMLDLCVLYGPDNRACISKMIQTAFEVQPKYKEDLIKAVPYFAKVLRNVQNRFKGKVQSHENSVPMKLVERQDASEMTLPQLQDLIIHVLDTAVNLSMFLDMYTPAGHVLHDQMFETNVVNFYQNTIPDMYAKLESLASSPQLDSMYKDLRHKLDLTRIYMLKIFHYIISSIINGALEKTSTLSEAAIKELAEDYVSTLTNSIAEKSFMRDYHTHHPVDRDLDVLSQLCPEIDSTKCDYLLESVLACFDTPPPRKPQKTKAPSNSPPQHSSAVQNDLASGSKATTSKCKVKGVELDSLITEVKDILPHLGEGFIQNCLEHFEYKPASVINSILEDSLPPALKALDSSLPKIPAELEKDDLAAGIQRLNVFDNDEFDIMTQDEVDTSRIHLGKRKPQHKDLTEMIDDKSHLTELRDMYTKLGIVDTEGSLYDDEYDDTYDHLDVSVGEAGDQERRPIVVPRVLQALEKRSSSEEESGEEEEQEVPGNKGKMPRLDFAQNPEEMRARAEQRRQAMRGHRPGPAQGPSRDVTGGPKGQGQDKKVLINRDHKTRRGNPNRRSGAARKRQQGMIPS